MSTDPTTTPADSPAVSAELDQATAGLTFSEDALRTLFRDVASTIASAMGDPETMANAARGDTSSLTNHDMAVLGGVALIADLTGTDKRDVLRRLMPVASLVHQERGVDPLALLQAILGEAVAEVDLGIIALTEEEEGSN